MTDDEIAAVKLIGIPFDEWVAICNAKTAYDSITFALLSVATVREAKLRDQIAQMESRAFSNDVFPLESGRQDDMAAFEQKATEYGLRADERADAMRWFLLGRKSIAATPGDAT